MTSTKHTHGFRRAATAAILACLTLTGSRCTKEPEAYVLTLHNSYFEALYCPQLGAALLADTLPVGEATPEASVERGSYTFTVETASGLQLSAGVQLQGEKQRVKLVVSEQGKVLSE